MRDKSMSGKSRSRKRSQAVNGINNFFRSCYICLSLFVLPGGALPNDCGVFYRKLFFYVFTRIGRPIKPDFICIRICFSLLYYCTSNNKPSFGWKFTSILRSVPHQNVLLYFKSFRFVASLVALYHSIVKLLAVKVSSLSDLVYFLEVAGQFPFFGAVVTMLSSESTQSSDAFTN